jgi:RNA polymerase sigma-70 factor (ECF subfamily)
MNRLPAARPDAENEPRQSARWLEEAFARYQDELLGMLYYVVGNAEDARDALQDAFIKCWKHRADLSEIENPRAWVFRVALNAGRDARGTAWRRHRRVLPDDGRQLVGDERSAEAKAIGSEQLNMVREGIRRLRPEEQEVFLLRQDGQMTYEQIAETIGVPVGTVKTRMRLALQRLREMIAKPKGP